MSSKDGGEDGCSLSGSGFVISAPLPLTLNANSSFFLVS